MNPEHPGQPVWRAHPRRIDVPLLAVVALGALLYGIQLPALELESFFGDEEFSVLTGIRSFLEGGNLLLALMLFGFSVLFPVVKLGTVLVLWFGRCAPDTQRRVLEWLELLGKWSLLDAFVIATLIGTVQLGMLSAAVARPGAYVYLGAILLSLLTTFLLRPLVREARTPRSPRLRRRGLWITLPAAALYGLGLSLPLIDVEKWWFWDNRYSLLQGIARMLDEGEVVLGCALALFVVLVPTVRFVGLAVLRLLESRDSRLVRALLLVDKWSMVDVFALALLVVFTKLGALADATPRAGLWLLSASAVLTGIDSWLLQRRRRA